MSTVLELVTRLEEIGAKLTLEGDRVKVSCPESVKGKVAPLLEELRGQRQRLIPLVCDHGGYCQKLNRAKARIAEHPHYDGLVPWLKRDHSSLYCSFYVDTPRRIHELYKAGAPIEEFQALLNGWIDVHKQGVDFYKAAQGMSE